MTQSKNTECYIFAQVTFAPHDFCYCYPGFIIHLFLNHGNGSESGEFFWGGSVGGLQENRDGGEVQEEEEGI